MKCDKAQELFSDHLESALERPMAIALERHLAECLVCERDYASFRTTWEMLAALPEVEPPPGFAWNVAMRVRLQREAEREAQTRWQIGWSQVFASRVPARVFAAAVAVFILALVVVRTPLRDVVRAWFVPVPVVQFGPDTETSVPMRWTTGQPAIAWLRSGLTFELDPSGAWGGRGFFKLLLKPKDATKKHVRVYLMEPGWVRFNEESIGRASLMFDGDVGASGQVIPWILGQAGQPREVLTILVEWRHRQREFVEAVFVPTQVSSMGAAMVGSVTINDMELYSALRDVSAGFGAVILVNADISAVVSNVSVQNGTVNDALYKISTSVGLRWRPLGSQVYMVERRIESE